MYEVFKGDGGEFFFRLRALNGEIVLQSEAYTRAEDAERGVKDVARAAIDSVILALAPEQVTKAKTREEVGISSIRSALSWLRDGLDVLPLSHKG